MSALGAERLAVGLVDLLRQRPIVFPWCAPAAQHEHGIVHQRVLVDDVYGAGVLGVDHVAVDQHEISRLQRLRQAGPALL